MEIAEETFNSVKNNTIKFKRSILIETFYLTDKIKRLSHEAIKMSSGDDIVSDKLTEIMSSIIELNNLYIAKNNTNFIRS